VDIADGGDRIYNRLIFQNEIEMDGFWEHGVLRAERDNYLF